MQDLDAGVAGVDTLYLADNTGTTGGLSAYTLDGNVQLFMSSPSALFSFTDTSGSTGTLSGSLTTIATASTNTAFRGLAVIPVPEPSAGMALLSGLGWLVVVRRRAQAKALLRLACGCART